MFDGLEGSGEADERRVEGLVRNVASGRGAPTRGSVWGARPEHMLLAAQRTKVARCPDQIVAIIFRPGYPEITATPPTCTVTVLDLI